MACREERKRVLNCCDLKAVTGTWWSSAGKLRETADNSQKRVAEHNLKLRMYPPLTEDLRYGRNGKMEGPRRAFANFAVVEVKQTSGPI
jgi:hypothetical protein